MLDMFFSILWSFISWLRYPIYFVVGVVTLFYLLVFINVIIGFIKGKRFKKGSRRFVKKHSFLRKIFIDLPIQFTNDLFNKDPDAFGYKGMIIFEGRQGNGKTISMVEFARHMQREYPNVKCITNLHYTQENDELDHWIKLTDYTNGKYGVIAVMDELQNWFSSNQSRDFPPEMLQTITQNRKNRRIILGTAQNFYLLAKPIRSQCTEVRRCTTLLGCLTIVRRLEPILDSEGNVTEWKKRGMYFFVHDEELRNSYDTYYVINSLAKSGFKEQQYRTDFINNTYIINETKKGK